MEKKVGKQSASLHVYILSIFYKILTSSSSVSITGNRLLIFSVPGQNKLLVLGARK